MCGNLSIPVSHPCPGLGVPREQLPPLLLPSPVPSQHGNHILPASSCLVQFAARYGLCAETFFSLCIHALALGFPRGRRSCQRELAKRRRRRRPEVCARYRTSVKVYKISWSCSRVETNSDAFPGVL